MGGMHQFFNILFLSPTLLQYYSPKQGLLDGIMFLLYIIICMLWFVFLYLLFESLQRTKNWIKWLLYLYVLFTASYFIIRYIELFSVVAYLALTAFIMSHFMFHVDKPHLKHTKEPAPISTTRVNRQYLSLIIIVFLVYFFGYSNLNYIFYTKNLSEVNNFNLISKSIGLQSGTQYSCRYSNGEYLFLKDLKNGGYVVLHGDIVTKDLWIKKN